MWVLQIDPIDFKRDPATPETDLIRLKPNIVWILNDSYKIYHYHKPENRGGVCFGKENCAL